MQPRFTGPNDKRVDASSTRVQNARAPSNARLTFGVSRNETRRADPKVISARPARSVKSALLPAGRTRSAKALLEIERICSAGGGLVIAPIISPLTNSTKVSEMGPEVGVRNKEDSVVAMPVVHWSCEAELRITNV